MGSEILSWFTKATDFLLCILMWWRRNMKSTMVARTTTAAPTQIPMIAPKESLDADEDEDEFASAAAVAEALVVLEDVLDDGELVVRVVEGADVAAALVTRVVEDC